MWIFLPLFIIFQNNSPLIFRSFRELLFLQKNNTMAILLKTTSVRVSSIQIMQVRVQNKGKSVWKSRYNGDVSLVEVGGRIMKIEVAEDACRGRGRKRLGFSLHHGAHSDDDALERHDELEE